MRLLDDPYEILGITCDASSEEIRAAHRQLLKSLHPDVGGPRALFEVVHHAYGVLSDPVRRAAYDAGEPLIVTPQQPVESATARAAAAVSARSPLWQRRPWQQRLVESIIAGQLTVGGAGVLTILMQ